MVGLIPVVTGDELYVVPDKGICLMASRKNQPPPNMGHSIYEHEGGHPLDTFCSGIPCS